MAPHSFYNVTTIMCEKSWDIKLRSLVDCNNWKEILNLGNKVPIEEKSRLLWAWPSLENLNYLKQVLNESKIEKVLSIGCGSGLLEWIIQQSIGCSVNGLEYDQSWWKSDYCPKPFIKLNYTIVPITSEFLQQCSESDDWNFALLFCYFNNRKAFLEYVNAYSGKCIIIIGPGEGRGTHTDPSPFEPNFQRNYEWKLSSFSEVGNTKDFIATYIKVK